MYCSKCFVGLPAGGLWGCANLCSPRLLHQHAQGIFGLLNLVTAAVASFALSGLFHEHRECVLPIDLLSAQVSDMSV